MAGVFLDVRGGIPGNCSRSLAGAILNPFPSFVTVIRYRSQVCLPRSLSSAPGSRYDQFSDEPVFAAYI